MEAIMKQVKFLSLILLIVFSTPILAMETKEHAEFNSSFTLRPIDPAMTDVEAASILMSILPSPTHSPSATPSPYEALRAATPTAYLALRVTTPESSNRFMQPEPPTPASRDNRMSPDEKRYNKESIFAKINNCHGLLGQLLQDTLHLCAQEFKYGALKIDGSEKAKIEQAEKQLQLQYNQYFNKTLNHKIISIIGQEFTTAQRLFEQLSPYDSAHAPYIKEKFNRDFRLLTFYMTKRIVTDILTSINGYAQKIDTETLKAILQKPAKKMSKTYFVDPTNVDPLEHIISDLNKITRVFSTETEFIRLIIQNEQEHVGSLKKLVADNFDELKSLQADIENEMFINEDKSLYPAYAKLMRLLTDYSSCFFTLGLSTVKIDLTEELRETTEYVKHFPVKIRPRLVAAQQQQQAPK